jgi:transcriptional regulator with XRE-family HTH domain
MPSKLKTLEIDRISIGRRLRELREQRLLTQKEVAEQLGVPQGRFSEIESGKRSLSAEQFLAILRLFNVPVSEFSSTPSSYDATIQNTIARLGANHLAEDPSVLPSELGSSIVDAIRETLSYGNPRLLTALAPVIVRWVDAISLERLYLKSTEVGLERRLGWLLENTLEGLRVELAATSASLWTRQYRRAEIVLRPFLDYLTEQVSKGHRFTETIFDVLDKDIRSEKTLASVVEHASAPSKKWRIWTRLQPRDFAHALSESRLND